MKILQMVFKDMKLMLSSIKFYVFIFLVFPILVAFLNGLMYEKFFNPDRNLPKARVALIDKDNSYYSKPLKDVMTSDSLKDIVTLSEESSLDKVKSKLQKGELSAAIVFNEDFSKNIEDKNKADIKVLRAPSAGIEAQIIYGIVSLYVEVLNNNIDVVNYLRSNVKDEKKAYILAQRILPETSKLSSGNYIKITNLEKDKKLTVRQMFAATMMALMSMYLCLSIAANMVEEKEKGMHKRLMSTSLSKNYIFSGKLLTLFSCILGYNVIYVIISSVLGVNWGNNLIILGMFICIHSLALAGIGALLISIFNKQKTLNAAASIVIALMAILGSTFYPADYYYSAAKKVAEFTLNYWIHNSYQSIMLGKGFGEMTVNIITLTGIGLIGIILGRVSFEKRS